MCYKIKLIPFCASVLICVLPILSPVQGDVILAAWDDWADTGADGVYDADTTFSGFSASLASQSSRINASWSSTDGTYGTVPGAPTAANGSFLTRATGSALTLTYTLLNNSGSDYTIESFNFDFAPRGDGATTESFGPTAFTLTYTGGGLETVGTEIASESGLTPILTGGTSDPNANSDYPDYSYALSPTLNNILLADGDSAEFTLVFSGQSGSNSANVSSMVDNVAFTGAVVPEPRSLILLTIMFGCIWITLRKRV